MPTKYQPTKKKGKYIKRTGKKAKGLTKQQRDQVEKIAKSSITSVAEKKYMNPNQFRGEAPASVTGNNYISVMAFSTMSSLTENGSQILYGVEPIKEIKALRYFPNAMGSATDNNRIIGKECKPVSSRTHFRISRVASNINSLVAGNLNHYPVPQAGPPSANELALAGLVTACPVVCRMIKVTPKISPATKTEIAPNTDLFVDEKGDAIGVNSASFYENKMLGYKVNRRRYTVLQDSKFTLQNPLSINWSWTQSEGAGSGDNNGWWSPTVTNGSSNCERTMNMYHQLTQKKHGSVRYLDPANNVNEALISQPITGHRREYVFLHFYYKGADNLPRTPNTSDDIKNAAPLDIRVDALNITKFIDV